MEISASRRTRLQRLERSDCGQVRFMADNPNVAPNSNLSRVLAGWGVIRMSRTDFPPKADLPSA
jgi:hypothetical protein